MNKLTIQLQQYLFILLGIFIPTSIAITNLINTEVNRFVFEGSRDSIVNQASEKALELLCRTIKKQ